MANPDTLNDERSLADAETALAREEQAVFQRQDALAAGNPVQAKAKALLARLEAAERAGASSPDLARAKTVLATAAAAEALPGQTERTAALAARRAALKAREAAVQAISAGLTQAETARAKQEKRVDAVEAFVAGTEQVLVQMKDDNRRAEQEAAAHAAEEAKAAAEARAAQEAEAKAAAKAASAKPAPPPVEAAPITPKVKAPAPVMAGEPPPVVAKPVPKAPAAKPVAAAASTQPGTKRVSRRRRVRLAPPPRKLAVEVAVFGENNFYTSFDNRIGGGGLFVASHETLPPGHELELEIDLEGKRINTRGRVEFSRLDNPLSADCTPGAGMKLINLSGDGTTAIESFFNKRAPMFYATAQ